MQSHHMSYCDMIGLVLRLIQMTMITTIMLTSQWFISLFDKEDVSANPHQDNHEWHPPQIRVVDGVTIRDLRSPCPALNTLANHGYLPRHGHNIKPHQFIKGLQEGYNISYPLAAFLTWGSFILLQQWRKVSLKDLARHGCVEHDASLVHADVVPGEEYAPIVIDDKYMSLLIEDSGDGTGLTAKDIAKARFRRESGYAQRLDAVHAEIARGEMAIVLGLFGVEVGDNKEQIPLQWLSEWWTYERIPSGWRKPEKPVGLIQTIIKGKAIGRHMDALRKK